MIGWVKPAVTIKASRTEQGISANITYSQLKQLLKTFLVFLELTENGITATGQVVTYLSEPTINVYLSEPLSEDMTEPSFTAPSENETLYCAVGQ